MPATPPPLATAAAPNISAQPANGAQPTARPASLSSSSMLLEGLKEELFQLEVERQQGRISEAEYQQTKSALDQTLQRALQRAKASQA
jgi:hypothetical protein